MQPWTTSDLPSSLASRIDTNGGIPTAPHTPVDGECWMFDGWRNSAGYPYVHKDGRDVPAHRVVYTAATSADLTGLDLDHLCRNPACVNPNHEEPVTHAENLRRMSSAMTGCRRDGHDWSDPINIAIRQNGRRYCKQCYRKGNGGHEKKYSNETLSTIRERHAAGATQASIAREFGMSSGLVSRIVNNLYRPSARP